MCWTRGRSIERRRVTTNNSVYTEMHRYTDVSSFHCLTSLDIRRLFLRERYQQHSIAWYFTVLRMFPSSARILKFLLYSFCHFLHCAIAVDPSNANNRNGLMVELVVFTLATLYSSDLHDHLSALWSVELDCLAVEPDDSVVAFIEPISLLSPL